MAKDLKWAYLIDTYGGLLTDKQLEVVDLYYNEDLSLSEIAENCGISRQGVRDSIKRAENTMLELEDSLKLAERMRAVQSIADSVRACAKEIIIENDRFGGSSGIDRRAQEIIDTVSGLLERGQEGWDNGF